MKNIKLKLRTKFSLSILSIVLIFGTVNVYLVNQNMLNSLKNEQKKRIFYIAKILANSSIRPILYEDYVYLQRLVDDTKILDPDIFYCFILDQNGRVLAHTFQNGFPVGLLTANSLQSGEDYSIQIISDGKDLYHDMAFPILDRQIGTVRIGMVETNITHEVGRVTVVMIAMVLGFLIVGIIGAFVSARYITKPISEIVQVSENFYPNKSQIMKIEIKNRDEIGFLAQKFNQMFERLIKADEEKSRTLNVLIESEKLASIGKLASGVAHEINNPLDGLQNCLNRLKRNPENLKQNMAYLGLMENALKRIEKAVKQLLDFSKGKELSLQPTNLNTLIKELLPLVNYSLEKDKIELKTNFDEKLPDILGDAYRLQQVVFNLILNSIDAMPNGGELILKTYVSDGRVNVEVSDTGISIPESELEKIFEPFYTTKEAGKGTGLGLAISLDIVKKHNGEILVKSHNGQGMTFICSFPIVQPIETMA